MPLHVDAVNDVRQPLQFLAAGVAILLLISCINVASLQVARAAARARDTAVKTALGAARSRLMRQHLAEALVLGLAGGAIGVALGAWGLAALLRLTPEALDRLLLARLSVPVAVTSIGLVLAWMALLAVAQVALSVVLVVAAVLLARTVQRTQAMHPGFEAQGVLSLRVALPGTRYPTQAAFSAFSRRLQDALATVPGATGASASSHAPYDHVPNCGKGNICCGKGEHLPREWGQTLIMEVLSPPDPANAYYRLEGESAEADGRRRWAG